MSKRKLKKLKVADLHHLGKLLSLAEGDFNCCNPHPDIANMAVDSGDESDEAAEEVVFELEEFISACLQYDDDEDSE